MVPGGTRPRTSREPSRSRPGVHPGPSGRGFRRRRRGPASPGQARRSTPRPGTRRRNPRGPRSRRRCRRRSSCAPCRSVCAPSDPAPAPAATGRASARACRQRRRQSSSQTSSAKSSETTSSESGLDEPCRAMTSHHASCSCVSSASRQRVDRAPVEVLVNARRGLPAGEHPDRRSRPRSRRHDPCEERRPAARSCDISQWLPRGDPGTTVSGGSGDAARRASSRAQISSVTVLAAASA